MNVIREIRENFTPRKKSTYTVYILDCNTHMHLQCPAEVVHSKEGEVLEPVVQDQSKGGQRKQEHVVEHSR